MKKNDFDFIAPSYDHLAKLVFGSQLLEAQSHWLPFIPERAKLLIIGGGSGRVLERLVQGRPSISAIDYIEASPKMLALAQRNCPLPLKGRTRFIHGTDTNIPNSPTYDAVFTAFFLDVFTQKNLPKVIGRINASLHENGVWLLTDFELGPKSPVWKKALVGSMYLFFRLTARLEGSALAPFERILSEEENFILMQKASFFHNMVSTWVWLKKGLGKTFPDLKNSP